MQKFISSCYTLNYIIYKHFTSNIAEKKAKELYNCELYHCSEIQFFQLYTTEVYILCFCFCIKREKHISSCYTLIIMQYTYILIRFNCMQNKFYKNIAAKQAVNYTIAVKQDSELYNCSEKGQRIIQFRPANYTLLYVQRIIQFLCLLWSAIMQSLLYYTNIIFLFAICESCPTIFVIRAL